MKKQILYFLMSFYCFPVCEISSQITTIAPPEVELQKAHIGLVDEFIKRFNGEELHPDIASSVTDSININMNLLSLFNQEQFVQEGRQDQDSVRAKAVDFVKTIQNDSVRINYSDTSWAAIAHCSGLVLGKQESFDVFLTVQSRGDGMYKWVINKVMGDCFNVSPKIDNENLIIYPDAHETKFIALNRICKEQPRNIRLFLSRNFEYDPTSVFTFLVFNSKLKIEYVERLEFVFLQVPGYAFHIQYFDRHSNNSGWLISNFYPLSDKDKVSFRKMINQNNSGQEASFPKDSAVSENYTHESTYTTVRDSISINSIIAKRIKEKLKLLQDYISFISFETNDKSAKEFYAQKLQDLFSPDAKVFMKNYKTGDTKFITIKKFSDNILKNRFKDINIDAVTSVVIKKSESKDENTSLLGVSIIPISFVESADILNTICDKIFPCHIEDTEDGVEYLFDFGNLYVTIN